MKIKLIESGGFTGRHRIAEEELSAHPQALKESIESAFYSTEISTVEIDPARDKKKYFIEYDGRSLPLESFAADDEVKKLIDKMKKNLHY